MAIRDIFNMYQSPGNSTTEDGRMLALSLAEIQTELMALREEIGKSSPVPSKVIQEIDTSGLEAAISKLKPLPPQNLDLNPVYRSYEQTSRAIKELLGEVRTTNHRMSGLGGGISAPDPKHLIDIKRRVNDADVRMDYSDRTDTNPVYIGRAESGTPTTSPWNIQHLTYDSSNRVIFIEYKLGVWDNRASLLWS